MATGPRVMRERREKAELTKRMGESMREIDKSNPTSQAWATSRGDRVRESKVSTHRGLADAHQAKADAEGGDASDNPKRAAHLEAADGHRRAADAYASNSPRAYEASKAANTASRALAGKYTGDAYANPDQPPLKATPANRADQKLGEGKEEKAAASTETGSRGGTASAKEDLKTKAGLASRAAAAATSRAGAQNGPRLKVEKPSYDSSGKAQEHSIGKSHEEEAEAHDALAASHLKEAEKATALHKSYGASGFDKIAAQHKDAAEAHTTAADAHQDAGKGEGKAKAEVASAKAEKASASTETGSRGGTYYTSPSGKKVYVKKG